MAVRGAAGPRMLTRRRCGWAGNPSGMMMALKSGLRKSSGRKAWRWCTRRMNGSQSDASSDIGQTRPPNLSSRKSVTPRSPGTWPATPSTRPCQAGQTGSRGWRTTRAGERGVSVGAGTRVSPWTPPSIRSTATAIRNNGAQAAVIDFARAVAHEQTSRSPHPGRLPTSSPRRASQEHATPRHLEASDGTESNPSESNPSESNPSERAGVTRKHAKSASYTHLHVSPRILANDTRLHA